MLCWSNPIHQEIFINEYIQHKLGKDTQDTILEDIVQCYEAANVNLKEQGFKVDGVFDAEIKTAPKLRRK